MNSSNLRVRLEAWSGSCSFELHCMNRQCLQPIAPLFGIAFASQNAIDMVFWIPVALVSLLLSINTQSGMIGQSIRNRISHAAALTCLAWLLGLQITSHRVTEIATWSLIMSSVSVAPFADCPPKKLSAWARFEFQNWTECLIVSGGIGSFLLAWISCYVIPLDMNESWQVWPIPCLIGCFAGQLLGFGVVGVAHIRSQLQIN